MTRARCWAVLALLFAVGLTYQALYTVHVFRVQVYGAQRPREPFYINSHRVVVGILPEAEEAGLRAGDRIELLNGRRFTGLGLLHEWEDALVAGELLHVTVTPAKRVDIRLAQSRIRQPTLDEWALSLTLYLVLPVLCLGLGMLIAILRPQAPMAWLLLLLMLCFAQVSEVRGWSGPLRLPVAVYRGLVEGTIAIWFLLLGLYFPSRLEGERRRPWLKWLLIGPLMVNTVFNCLARILWDSEIDWLPVWESAINLSRQIGEVCAVAAVVTALLAIAFKTRCARGQDAHRRLRILLAGAAVSLTPLLLLVIRAFALGRGLFDGVPAVLAVPACLLLILFPVTLAHVIVVHRAMDLRVGLRIGMKYLLARRGLAVCRALVVSGIVVTLLVLMNSPGHSLPGQLTILGSGVVLLMLLQTGVAKPLGVRIDRRFFRDQRDSEAVLERLRHEDRGSPDQSTLIETVRRRVGEALHASSVHVLLRNPRGYQALDMESAFLESRSRTVRHLEAVGRPQLVRLEARSSRFHALPEADRSVLRELRAEVLTPLPNNRGLIGILSLGPKRSEEPYSKTDFELLAAVASPVGLALENCALVAKLAAEAIQREQLKAEKLAVEQANQAKAAFLANMSHELRTPLNAILGYSEMIIDELPSSASAHLSQDLGKVVTSARHLLEMINAVLDISKIDAGKDGSVPRTLRAVAGCTGSRRHRDRARADQAQPAHAVLSRRQRPDVRRHAQGAPMPCEPAQQRQQVHGPR
jgi:sigma-B regulation protein RsbU (phosphoserine phosphatase)